VVKPLRVSSRCCLTYNVEAQGCLNPMRVRQKSRSLGDNTKEQQAQGLSPSAKACWGKAWVVKHQVWPATLEQPLLEKPAAVPRGHRAQGGLSPADDHAPRAVPGMASMGEG
jgi:hypothetical protein